MTPEQLKASILQRAMEGKLVEQNPDDEPASELLKRIKSEKEKLILEGKIKKDKKESFIFRDIDGKYYEKINNKVVQEIEVPYELPENWEWSRISNIYWNYGQEKPEEEFKYIDTGSIDNKKNIIKYNTLKTITPESAPSRARKKVRLNSVLFSTVRPYLKNIAIVSEVSNYLIASTAFIVMDTSINKKFLKYCLISDSFISQVNVKSTGTSYPAINDNNFNELLIPIPPLQEQKRIVEQIEIALKKVDEYAESYHKLEKLNTEFPEKLKKSFLQYAMEGKLVEQDLTDEPASELLKRIKSEKEKLVLEGKIKKDKKESYIFKDIDGNYYEKINNKVVQEIEVPFEIPESWKWVRLKSVTTFGNFTSVRGEEIPNDSWVLDMEDLEKGTGNILRKVYKTDSLEFKSNKYKFEKGSILYGKLRPYLMKVGIADEDGFCTTEIFPIMPLVGVTNSFLRNIMLSQYFVKIVNQSSYGVKMPRVGTTFLSEMFIPIPPLKEQNRIVEQIEISFNKVDEYAESIIVSKKS